MPSNTRYLVEWTPWADVHAAARQRGMALGGDVGDFVDIDEFEVTRSFRSLALAAAFAKDVVEPDTWHCPRIRRQIVIANDHDDLGNRVPARPDWETDATWEVFSDSPAPVESKPDWVS